jgi:hypothetical protein
LPKFPYLLYINEQGISENRKTALDLVFVNR